MADENDITTTPEGEQAEAEQPNEADLARARALLEQHGYHALTDEDFGRIKEKAAKPYKSEAEKHQEELARLREEREQLAAEKAERENEGKTKAELLEQQLRQSHEDIKAKEAEIEQMRQQTEQERQTRLARDLDLELSKMLTGAVNPEAALVWAKAQMPGLSMGDDGRMVITKPNGMDLEGADARAAVDVWWEQQSFLRSGGQPGPPTGGSKSSPKPKEQKFNPRDYSDLNESLRAAQEFDAAKGRS